MRRSIKLCANKRTWKISDQQEIIPEIGHHKFAQFFRSNKGRIIALWRSPLKEIVERESRKNFQKQSIKHSPRYLLIRWIMLLLKGNNCVMIFIEFLNLNRMLNARLKPLILHLTSSSSTILNFFSLASRVIIITWKAPSKTFDLIVSHPETCLRSEKKEVKKKIKEFRVKYFRNKLVSVGETFTSSPYA